MLAKQNIPVWVKWLISTVIGIGGVIAWSYGVASPDLKGCTLFGEPSRLTLAVMLIVAASGWALWISQVIPALIYAYKPVPVPLPPLPIASEHDICAALSQAKFVQIFVSKSDRLRSLVTTQTKKLPRDLKIQVLVRDDGTQERAAVIATEAQKWRDDVGKGGVTLEIRTYKFDPVMFRGLIFDRETAILGWYFRGDPLKQHNDLDMYRVNQIEALEHISLAFDDMFARGSKL
jgi:hypothetical protein